MEEAREIVVSINERSFNLDLPIDAEKLIASVLLGLGQYVKKGFPIKIKQSSKTFSGSQVITTKLVSKPQQIAEWGKETKRLISALLR